MTTQNSAPRPPHALIAMSGGVDSSVAAWLMQRDGYDCTGITMRLTHNEMLGQSGFHTCCSEKDIEDAAEVAFALDIPYEVLDFTDSYATGVQVVIVKEGSDVTLDNLGEKMIGTQRGTTGYIYTSDDYGDDHVTAYDNGASAVQALINGQVDCVVIDSAPAEAFVAANAGLTILDTEYVTESYAIGVNKDNTALLDAINQALAELTADGTVQSIVDKYISAE